MRRCDNAYRWVLLEIMRCRKERENSLLAEEYLKLKISDIYALKESNHALRVSMGNVRYFLALENELFCTYDYDSGQLRINQFNDNEWTTAGGAVMNRQSNILLPMASYQRNQ